MEWQVWGLERVRDEISEKAKLRTYPWYSDGSPQFFKYWTKYLENLRKLHTLVSSLKILIMAVLFQL